MPFRTRKTAGVLAFMAYYLGRTVAKDLVVDAFWPDSPPERGRQSLRSALSSIRMSLDRPDLPAELLIESDHATARLVPDHFQVDTSDFARHWETAHAPSASDSERLRSLWAAHELYAGPFLPGFPESWVVPQMMDLEERYVQVTAELASLLSTSGETDRALSVGRRALALCPGREELYIAMMRANAQAGRNSAVVQLFEELERVLADEWGEGPSQEALDVLNSLPRWRAGALVSEADSGDLDVTTLDGRRPVLDDTRVLHGRDEEVAELKHVLAPRGGQAQLVTLTGLGGSGKTRLALAAARSVDEDYDGRVWIVSLVALLDGRHFADAVFSQLRPGAVPEPDPVDAIARSIGPEPALLVLDNLEQLLPEASAPIRALLARCPRLRVLATSRIPVGIEGEHVSPVGPLAIPRDYQDLGALRACPSVSLLVERAQVVRPGFSVGPVNARAVCALCNHLEGIPLSIELAATKLAVHSPTQILGSIGRRVDLASSHPALVERHRSLRAVIDWAWDTLSDECKDAFSRLSVCSGGFTVELASSILGRDASGILPQLTRSSLVVWSETDEELRFDMLETVREAAAELLDAEPAARRESAQRHFSYFHQVCTDPSERTDADRWARRLDREQSNLLTAVTTAQTSDISAEEAWSLVLGLRDHVRRRGLYALWLDHMRDLLSATESRLSAETAAAAHMIVASTAYGLRDVHATHSHYQSAIQYADKSGDPALRAQTRASQAASGSLLGRFDETRRTLEEAVRVIRPAKDPLVLSRVETNLGWIIYDGGDESGAEPTFRDALKHAEESGDQSSIASALVGLGCAVGETRYGEAQPIFDRAETIREEIGFPDLIAHCLYLRGLVDYRNGALDPALANVQKALFTFVGNGVTLGQVPLTVAGTLVASLGRGEDAARLWGRAEASRRRYGMLMFPTLRKDYERELPAARETCGGAAFQAAFDWGGGAQDETLLQRVFDAT